MWKWAIALAALPVAAAAMVILVGLALPREHGAVAETVVAAPPERVAALVREVEAQPSWRSGVTSVEVLERRGHRLRYIERSGSDAITFDFLEEAAGERFRSTIADPDLPFGGFWIVTVAPEGEGARVRIEEQGHVGNPIYRFFAALVFGHDRTMKNYLADLERALRS